MKYLENINKKQVIILTILFLIGLLISIVVLNQKKEFKETRTVLLFSGNKNYEKEEEGAWKLKKTAKWTDTYKARITFNFDSIAKQNGRYQDVLFVIDVSGSMSGDKINKVKSDAKELAESVLSNSKNNVGIITFDTSSEIILGLTNDKDTVLKTIDSLTVRYSTNYYQALLNVEKILENYQKESNRDFKVLFLTDGYPNEDIPNQNGEYTILKDKYPYIDMVGIQYEMGKDILDPIIKISDRQYIADMNTLNNVLFEAGSNAEFFEKVEIVDYINNDDFYVESEDDIHPSIGTVNLTKEKGKQKVTWTINPDELRTGIRATLTIDVTLKEVAYDDEYVITNDKEQITVKLPDEDEEKQTTTIRPQLKNKYDVIYDGNQPKGCSVSVPSKKSYRPFEQVTIEDETTCKGYNFKEWYMKTKDVTMANSKTFIMPDEDVNFIAKWGKITAKKTMDGEIAKAEKLVDYLILQANSSSVTIYNNGNKKEMYTFKHDKTEQTEALTDYRFIGNEPNNYVYFNCSDDNDKNTCEVWRIIGVFEVEDGNGHKENRVKLIRGSALDQDMPWDSNEVNDWSKASLKTYLNTTYYDSLSESTKSMIDDAKYYLGGGSSNSTSHYGDGANIYTFERGTKVYNGHSTNWTGKIALMYISDYVYTYALGVDDTCYKDSYSCGYKGKPLLSGWIYNTHANSSNWTLTPYAEFSKSAFYVGPAGTVYSGYHVKNLTVVRPIVYLISDIYIEDGDGSASNPYQIYK